MTNILDPVFTQIPLDLTVFLNPQIGRYTITPGEFDQGIGCLIRANNSVFQENSIKVEVMDQLKANFIYGDREEMIGNIISISPVGNDVEFKVSDKI